MEEPLRDDPIPLCCTREMVLLRSGRCAGFAIRLWRCAACERFEWTNRRHDGQTFWVGAMAEAIHDKRAELVADAYSADVPPDGGSTTR